jgi:hypothetical protein
MPLPERNHLRQFLLFVFVLLIPCFAVWTVLSARLATPVIGLCNIILSHWFPDIVNVVYQQGADALLMTHFDQVDGLLVPAAEGDVGLGFRLNTRILSYSIPFYAALHFATEKEHYFASFFWGLLWLYTGFLMGLLCLSLKELMVTLGSVFLDQPGVLVPGADAIGIAYQLNILIVPTLAPALIWAWQSRDTPLLRGFIPAQTGSVDA